MKCPNCNNNRKDFDTSIYNKDRGSMCMWCEGTRKVSLIDYLKWYWYAIKGKLFNKGFKA